MKYVLPNTTLRKFEIIIFDFRMDAASSKSSEYN